MTEPSIIIDTVYIVYALKTSCSAPPTFMRHMLLTDTGMVLIDVLSLLMQLSYIWKFTNVMLCLKTKRD